ncbi:MAG: hypothetical protein ACREUW_12760 [Burkholderiales bacterium]
MSPRRGLCLLPALLFATHALAADQIEVIGTSAGLSPPPPPVTVCSTPDCATVVSVIGLGKQWKQVKRMDGSGVYMGEAPDLYGDPTPLSNMADSGLMTGSPIYSAQDEALAPMAGEYGLVRDENLWHIVVRFDDGTTRTLEQNYPPLFQAGARVRVDGRRLQLAQ